LRCESILLTSDVTQREGKGGVRRRGKRVGEIYVARGDLGYNGGAQAKAEESFVLGKRRGIIRVEDFKNQQ